MKINILSIVKDHWSTLYDARSNSRSLTDVIVFYGVPTATSIAAWNYGFSSNQNIYNVSITFFGIFVALLLNIQVAIFGIFQRKWEYSDDERIEKLQKEVIRDRRRLLIEVNINLSYLIVICCAALFISLLSFVQEYDKGAVPALMIFLYTHFLLTLLMVVKRAHALFHKEYRDSPG
ncbi:hypothetical protein [Sphingopyxis fribergensis]